MTLQKELQEAQNWYASQSHVMKDEFSALISLVVSSLYGEADESLISKFGPYVRKKLGMTAHFVLSDREMVERCIFHNGLLLWYRLFGMERGEKQVEFLLRLLENFFSNFRNFLDQALSKVRKSIEIDKQDAFDAAHKLVNELLKVLLPHGSASIVMPELPLMFQGLAVNYLDEAYQNGQKAIQKLLIELLLNQKQKEKLFIQVLLSLHSFLMKLQKKPSFEKNDTQTLNHLQHRAESVVEQAYYCFSQDGAKAVRFCPKYRGGEFLLSALSWSSQIWHSKGSRFLIHTLSSLLQKKEGGKPTFHWDSMELILTNKACYEDLFTRIAEQKMERFNSLPMQFLVQGVMSFVIQSKLDDFPWEKNFQALLFGVRRLRNYILSPSLLNFLKRL